MITHETRRESHETVNKTVVQRQVLMAFEHNGAMTARDCAAVMGRQDYYNIRPRITELCQDGKLTAVGKRRDPLTGKLVALYQMATQGGKQ